MKKLMLLGLMLLPLTAIASVAPVCETGNYNSQSKQCETLNTTTYPATVGYAQCSATQGGVTVSAAPGSRVQVGTFEFGGTQPFEVVFAADASCGIVATYLGGNFALTNPNPLLPGQNGTAVMGFVSLSNVSTGTNLCAGTDTLSGATCYHNDIVAMAPTCPLNYIFTASQNACLAPLSSGPAQWGLGGPEVNRIYLRGENY